MNKIYKKIAQIVLTLLLVFSLVSCGKYSVGFKFDISNFLDRIGFEYKEDVKFASVSETLLTNTNENNESGDVLNKLGDDVTTLSKYELPSLDEIISGFKVKGKYDFDERNAVLVEFEHEKTGATVFLISNDDIDRSVILGFNTLAYDDRGIPHIFEHATLGGSKKFSSPNLFFEMTNKTYSTYLNATTLQCSTIYPMGSLSEEQLFSYYKFYIDGVFNPDVLRDEKNFEREAYRYVLNDAKDDLDIAGVVYSEMAAHEGNISYASSFNTEKTLFPNSIVSFNTGGKVDEIPKITNDDLIEFHNTYYHPSNLLITLYGDIDYRKYLSYADEEYLSSYDKKIIDKEDKLYVKNDGFVEKVFEFPVASGSDVENAAIAKYAISCEGLTPYEAGVFTVIVDELNSSDGPFATEVNEKIPKALYSVACDLASPRPYICFDLENVNENDRDVILDVVESAIKKLLNDGVREETIITSDDSNNMTTEITKDSHGFTDDATSFYSISFMNNGEDLLSYLRYIKGLKEIKDRYYDGTIFSLIKKYFSDNSNAAFTITVPAVGELENVNKKRKDILIAKKENMTETEINDLIKKNKDYDKWVEDCSKNSIIDRVRVASVSGLDEYRADCYAYEENVEGIRFIRSDIDNIKYSYVNMLLDASGIPYDDVLKLKLASDLLLYLPTKNYEDFRLEAEFNKYAYSYGVSLDSNKYFDGGYNPYLSLQFMALDKNVDKVFELYTELIYETEFNDVEKLLNFVSQQYNSIKTGLNSDPSYYAETLLNAKLYNDALYDLHINGIDYMKYLYEVSHYDETALNNLLHECKELLSSLYNRSGMVCCIISNFKTMPTIKSKVLELSNGFKDERIAAINYDEELKKSLKNTGIISNSYIQYNYLGIALKEHDLEFTSKYYVIDAIVNDKILYPEFRVKRSAYGSSSHTGRLYTYVETYRDPGLKETFDTFKTLPSLIKNVKISEDELEDYKLNAYSNFSYPMTKIGAATTAIDEVLMNCSDKRPDRFVRYMREIKETTIDDINALKEKYTIMAKEGEIVSSGSRDQIENNVSLFDEIIYDLVE